MRPLRLPPNCQLPGEGRILTLALRLSPPVHEQLREQFFTSRWSQHSLLMEGLCTMSERHGKSPIAPRAS
jgi:hypothetical protein